eukprot:4513762-Prymnesium_polylepis.1
MAPRASKAMPLSLAGNGVRWPPPSNAPPPVRQSTAGRRGREPSPCVSYSYQVRFYQTCDSSGVSRAARCRVSWSRGFAKRGGDAPSAAGSAATHVHERKGTWSGKANEAVRKHTWNLAQIGAREHSKILRMDQMRVTCRGLLATVACEA